TSRGLPPALGRIDERDELPFLHMEDSVRRGERAQQCLFVSPRTRGQRRLVEDAHCHAEQPVFQTLGGQLDDALHGVLLTAGFESLLRPAGEFVSSRLLNQVAEAPLTRNDLPLDRLLPSFLFLPKSSLHEMQEPYRDVEGGVGPSLYQALCLHGPGI